MSRREDVLAALHALLVGVAGALVRRNVALPIRIPAEGLVILRDGDPGEPETSLSPLMYHYEHAAQVEVIVQAVDTQDALFDAICAAIGARLEANRTLGGQCDWVEGSAPAPTDIITEGGEPMKGAVVTITLTYATPSPI
jgi:hypothetical protein